GLAALEVFEAGKPVAEADADVCEAIDFCEYYGRAALRLGAGTPVLSPAGETNVYRYQPRGVGVVIAPWNFPLAIPAGMTTAALVAGNCVVLKPAEQTPGVADAGQKCSAAGGVIAVGPVFEELLERLVGATAIVPVGHAREVRTVVGPLIDEEASRRVHDYQAVARTEGEVVYQHDELPAGGWYVGPTVVVTRDPRARIATEEIFGPLLTVLRADDFEHALALANDTAYALTGGLFSRSPVHIRRAADEFRAGNLYVNRAITGARVGRQPFGGYGLSGVGSKAGGPDYLLQFVEPRTVTENTIRQGFAPVE